MVVIGANGKAFCSGHDLNEIRSYENNNDDDDDNDNDDDDDETRRLFDTCGRVMLTLRSLPQPVISMVQGVTTAAGCQLVASCDLAVSSSDAKFGVSGINLGL